MVESSGSWATPDGAVAEGQAAPDTVGTDISGTGPSFMERLAEEDRRALASRACSEWHTPGSVICREGEPGDALYIVESGRVAILKEVSGGRHALLGYRGAGEILGEMSLVGEQPRFASAVAQDHTHLLRVDAADFPALMDENPGIRWAVLNVLNDRLVAADMERTAIIQEERAMARQLEQVTGEAERLAELARVRQETIELIAHDLRAPLAVIDGCLELLRTFLSEDALKSVSRVMELAERGSGRLIALVEELLRAAHQEKAGLPLVRQPVDLVRLVQGMVDSVRVTAQQCQVRLDCALPANLPQPQGDAIQLERVLGNLLDNAISYTPCDGRIEVAAVERDGTVEVSVTDTGPGVPPEHREDIFERFTRVPGVEGRKKGYGLGLYSCRQIVEAHGGRIWVEPGPQGVGSRFVFTLPVDVGQRRG